MHKDKNTFETIFVSLVHTNLATDLSERLANEILPQQRGEGKKRMLFLGMDSSCYCCFCCYEFYFPRLDPGFPPKSIFSSVLQNRTLRYHAKVIGD